MNSVIQQNINIANQNMIKDLENKREKIDDIKKAIQDTIDNSIFYKLQNIEGQLLFKYVAIFLFSFKFFKIVNISIPILIAIVFAYMFTYINYDRDQIYTGTKQKNLDFKLETLEPKPKNFKNHNNLIEFVYSIREFREYNSDSFDKMIQCIDNILQLSKDIKIGTIDTNDHVDVMIDNQKKAMNYLHSIIHNMETSRVIVDKHAQSMQVLKSILKYYIDEAIDISNQRLKQNGYNIMSKIHYKDDLDGFENNSLNSNVYDDKHFKIY
tara:strand:+ start:113 stop:916 length:804 start_codon:yes stop_codon:yes gene_type:complete